MAKKRAVRKTRIPTVTPRMTPPPMNPAMIIHGGVGETRISSMLRTKNLDIKKVVATFEKELVITASMTSPGITKWI